MLPVPVAGPLPMQPGAMQPGAMQQVPGQQVLAPSALPASEPIRTMEDTVAELLRPMLRQWLDANMPRIVEKALRVELAESAKKKH